jgi:hypothetical protein
MSENDSLEMVDLV